MSVTYTVEPWAEVWPEMAVHWRNHWEEVALDKDTIPLDPDIDLYQSLDNAGALHIVVARKAGEVIGYHLSFVRPHAHYRGSLHAFTDIYYVAPEHRQGMTGVRLFQEAERTLKARGVVKMISATKLQDSAVTKKSLDMSRIFRRLRWRQAESTFTKYIGD